MKKIALIPIDNRPICYNLIEDILAQDGDIKLFMPERKHLGGLTSSADIESLYDFLNNLPKVDILVICLDTIAYGGLVSSRRCPETFDEIKSRIEKFKQIINGKAEKILAFSSIMRISNNSINEEEKEYWNPWGKKIFEYSFNFHKTGSTSTDIPVEILQDYLNTRKRNFEINKLYLDWLKDKTLDTLVFSKDDTGEFGLNVIEANKLQRMSDEQNLGAIIKTGADEIPLTLLARALCENKNIKVNPIYANPKDTDKISKYEDINVKSCVEGQLNLANIKIDEDCDLVFYINNFKKEQGDLVLGDVINLCNNIVDFPKKPYFIADINNANGADNNFIEQLLKQGLKNLYSYCGYNTSANSIGCAILSAVVKLCAKKYNENAFKKLMLIRLLDDWAYQANIRKYVRENAPEFNKALNEKLQELMKFEKTIAKFLDFKYNEIKYSLPWDRSFEIEINL